VNTADSRVELRWDVAASDVLTEAQRARLMARLRLTTDGTLSVTASEHRSQLRNRVAARARLAQRIATALAPDAVRQPGRATQRERPAWPTSGAVASSKPPGAAWAPPTETPQAEHSRRATSGMSRLERCRQSRLAASGSRPSPPVDWFQAD
jgi:hypothetical protein